MILVDTSVWVDHLRRGDAALQERLEAGQVLSHPFVRGELAMGSLRHRDLILGTMRALPNAAVARDEEVMGLISRRRLFGRGVGYIDAHLLAAVQLTPGAALWTRDKRLLAIAQELVLTIQ